MYHSMILEDCLDLLNICSEQRHEALTAFSEELLPVVKRMAGFLKGMTHPDGQIALFNDAAFGIEVPPQELFGYYERLSGERIEGQKKPTWSFPDTGYFVMAPREGDRLIVDCGPVGPDYQPGHSHCDTLSFELSLQGRRVIVDSGCCQYEDGEIRRYNRGNAGHNAITVDGENQSEVWGAHRCARRAKPVSAKLANTADSALLFEGAHDGYRRLKGSPTHRRLIRWAGSGITIEDIIEGQGVHAIESRLHIHPDLEVKASDNGPVVYHEGHVLMTATATGPGSFAIEDGWYCPEFNRKIKCPVLTMKIQNAPLPFRSGWKIAS
jgi:uncharacterized heparinase superfamily protein